MTEERALEVDSDGLRALAHPLRMRILRLLTLRKVVSVTSLAEELGETTGTTSYHLRQLARHGFVEPVDAADDAVPDGTSAATGRKRQWWRMAVDRVSMQGFEFLSDARTREAAGFVLRDIQADRHRRMSNWYMTATEWPEEWQRASSDSDMTFELDPTQLRALADELAEVVTRYRTMPPGADARMVDVQYAVFPSDDGTRP